MLNSLLHPWRARVLSRIERHHQDRYLPHAVAAPAARTALFAIARVLFAPGERIILSPVTCHSVVEALLAARLVPVFADVDPETGLLDPGSLPDSLLRRAAGLATSNLYGYPDALPELQSLCAHHGLALIEDCSHTLLSLVQGRETGTFGHAAIFSFGKQLSLSGGLACLRDPRAAAQVRDLIHAITPPASLSEEMRSLLRPAAAALLPEPLRALLHRAAPAAPAASSGPRRWPPLAVWLRVARALDHRDLLAATRLRAAAAFTSASPLPVQHPRHAGPVCPLALPVLSIHRDEIIARLQDEGIPTYFLYHPPLNERFHHAIPADAPHHLRWPRYWTSRVLPVNPRHAQAYLRALRSETPHETYAQVRG